MIRAGIVGATGYTGAELVRLLASHPEVEIRVLTSRQYAGERYDGVYPALAKAVDLTLETYAPDKLARETDVVFIALPHKLAMEVVVQLESSECRIIDLSADFRFKDPKVYESHYQTHCAPHLLEKAVYGLCEIYKEEITDAKIIGNPGCYPTSVLLPLIPLIKQDLIKTDLIIADSKSGVSGAGRGLALTSHYCEVNESFKPYKVGNHRHTPEMEAVLSREAGTDIGITFVPHLVPMTRGMQSTIYVTPKPDVTAETIRNCYSDFYKDKPFIRMRDNGQPPNSLQVKGTNFCDIAFVMEPRNNRLILMSAIDNLVKGASGQAVQNMNIMFGFKETSGIGQIPAVL